MFGMGVPELILILAIALVVIGPKKLPGLAKSMGRAMREFKKATSELKQSMEIDELDNVKKAFVDMNSDVKEVLTSSLDSGSDSIADAAPKPAPAEKESDKTDAGDGPASEAEFDYAPTGEAESDDALASEAEAGDAPTDEAESDDAAADDAVVGDAAVDGPEPGETLKSENGDSDASEPREKLDGEPVEAERERKDG